MNIERLKKEIEHQTRNGKKDEHTLKFDLATTTIKQLTKVLSCFENYTILNYQHLSNEVL